jgi:hypothetical protein
MDSNQPLLTSCLSGGFHACSTFSRCSAACSRRRRREILATLARLVNPGLKDFLATSFFKLGGLQIGAKRNVSDFIFTLQPSRQDIFLDHWRLLQD